jgi:hypothetical protein
LDIYQQHLDHYGNERDTFLDRIIFGDKTWMQYSKLESIWQSMKWKHPQLSGKKRLKSQPSAGKLMLTIF